MWTGATTPSSMQPVIRKNKPWICSSARIGVTIGVVLPQAIVEGHQAKVPPRRVFASQELHRRFERGHLEDFGKSFRLAAKIVEKHSLDLRELRCEANRERSDRWRRAVVEGGSWKHRLQVLPLSFAGL